MENTSFSTSLSSTNLESPDVASLLSSSDIGINHDNTKRRSSSRSIKRRRFDDEIVEYSLGLPGSSSALKSTTGGRTRTHSLSNIGIAHSTQVHDIAASLISTPPNIAIPQHAISSGVVSASTTIINTTASPPPHTIVDGKKKHYPIKQNIMGVTPTTRTKKRGRQHNHLTTKDLGRWKPMDDLALIIGVQQTNDLKTVHLGTKFSCRFTVQELQQRWYALLYDEAVSRVAVAAMRSLHPDIVAIVQDRALWSEAEEKLLSTITSQSNPTIETFEELLSKHSDIFYPQRNAKSLHQHWCTLRQYHLLPDQSLTPLPNNSSTNSTSLNTLITPQTALDNGIPMNFNDAEDAILSSELSTEGYVDEEVETNIALTQRKNIMEIRQLENELSRWHVLVDSVTGYSPPDFDSKTLAVLRGRLVRYLMRSREITIGRSAKGYEVDVDLSLEGPAWKVSRRQGTLRLRNTGEFFLSSEGKRPIFVDGSPILQGQKIRLHNNSIVEISCLRFIFTVNMDLIRIIRNEAIRLGLPP